ncbi:hypothetical protein HQ587_05070 [bacterium]|nr:hypothetical protein [bacterium]
MLKHLHKLHFSIVFIGSLTVLFAVKSFASDWKLLKPAKGKKVTLEISGKKRSYWKLDQKNTVLVRITGPGELKIITRMELKDDSNEDIYSFITTIDGKKQPLIARATEYSSSVVNPRSEKHRIGKSRTIIYVVADGEHEYRFSLKKDSKNTVYIRPLASNHVVKEDISYVAYLPRSFPEEARITVKEREYIYYRSNSESAVELEVIGPTRVKCISRLEFNHSMRVNKPYRIQVLEGSKLILTDFFNAKVSGTAEYSQQADMILGKGDTFYIDVPSGTHRYMISTPDTDINVIFRFYIPERDLGNEDAVISPEQYKLVRF